MMKLSLIEKKIHYCVNKVVNLDRTLIRCIYKVAVDYINRNRNMNVKIGPFGASG